MYQYFAFNIIYSFIVFMYLYSLKTAPFRVRFRIVLLAMISWLLPYDLINNFLVQDNSMVFSTTISGFNSGIRQIIVSQIDSETYLTFLNFIAAMTFIGFIWFMKDVLSLKIKLQKLSKEISLYKSINGIEIYKMNNQEIFTTGLIKPKIVIGEKYLNSPFTDSIIKHELQHIRSNDQWWLLLITLVQRLLWWNPIVYLLAHKGRELIELSCDQACKEESTDNQYQQDLAQILVQTNQESNPLVSHFFGKDKFNIFRIKQLSKEFTMNTTHKTLIFSTAFVPFVLMLLVITSSVSSEETKPIGGVSFDTMPIKENQAKIVLDAHLYIDDPDVVITPKEPNANLKTNFNTHKSFAASVVVNLDESFSLGATELQDFKMEVLPTLFENDSLLFSTKISFSVLGEVINLDPALAIRRHDTGHIILDDENGRYKFELYITVRQ
ncbi:hypothetical protein MNBD_GAMMA01-1798 [hydrothermal vent metagenome]|uniref:Peptidase M56 domain-containing protein n=1 Tax=hydrothermal vent metagenome TaxID=652676 RepID=A0A3B0VP64_9ZZZZ